MRPMWSGSLSFGLVNIPVSLYKASDENRPPFHYLHKQDAGRVRYVRVCQADGKEVDYKDLVHGYEYRKDEFVVLTDSDLEKANVRKTSTIDIVAFVDPDQVDTVYYAQPYYLAPNKGAEKAYSLLAQALDKTGKVGIGKFVFKNREHIGMLRPHGKALILQQIRYDSELRPTDELAIPAGNTGTSDELKMAVSLINQLAGPFEPAKYHDTYREDIDRIVAERVAGKETSSVGAAPDPTRAKDLMNALLASLDSAGDKTGVR